VNTQNFTSTFTVDQSPADVFAAIKNVRGWWTGGIDGRADKLGDEFSYRFEDVRCIEPRTRGLRKLYGEDESLFRTTTQQPTKTRCKGK
jgi:hypothetical protein